MKEKIGFLSFIPIPALAVAIFLLYSTVSPSLHYDPVWLISVTNTLFITLICLAVAIIAVKNYRVTGRVQVLMLGCGALAFGLGGMAAGFLRGVPDGANINVTIYNISALIGALFHFAAALVLISGLSPEAGARRKGTWLLFSYSGITVFMVLVTLASLRGILPTFFIQGAGPTPLRQAVLGSADILFAFSFIVFIGTYFRNREAFLYWYSLALALTSISLAAFFIEHSVGSPVGWAGRFAQYLGGVYFLAAILKAIRSAQARNTSLDNVLTSSLSPPEERFRVLAENRRRAEEALRESEQRVRLKLESILSPEGDTGDLELAEIIDVPALQSKMESFYKISRFPMAIIDVKGKVLVGVGWQKICTEYHRRHPETSRYCLESDTQLSAGVAPGEAKLYKCKNRMWDIATPIMVGGQHVGNVFSGQFFFEEEPVDYEFFRAQARKYCFDEKEYMAALGAVPRISREWLDAGMDFLMKLAQTISQLSYSNIKLARSLAQQDALTKSLKRVKEEWERTFDSVPDLMAIMDDRHRIVRANRAMAQRLGVSPQECAGQVCYMGVHGMHRPHSDCPHSLTIADGRAHEAEIHEDRLGGDFLVTTTPLSDESGRMIGSVHIARDITARKRMEREKADFLAMLTHDLKSPLSTIIGYSELLMQKGDIGAEDCFMLSAIEQGGSKLLGMVNDFLTISRMESGSLDLNAREEDMGDVIKGIEEEYRPLALKKGMEFTVKAEDGLLVRIDKKHMERAVANLVENAFNYTPDGGEVVLTSAWADGGVVISVRDTGIGVPPEEQARVFDKYYRSQRTKGTKGTGLGLAIVKAVAEAHGGSVGLASGPEKGSTFRIFLPF